MVFEDSENVKTQERKNVQTLSQTLSRNFGFDDGLLGVIWSAFLSQHSFAVVEENHMNNYFTLMIVFSYHADFRHLKSSLKMKEHIIS